MRFRFTFPAELKSQLDRCMEIEKAQYEIEGKKGFMKANIKLFEKMMKISRRIAGTEIDVNVPWSWEWEFVSDTEMLLDIVSPVDQIISFLEIMSVQRMAQESKVIKWLKKKIGISSEQMSQKKKEAWEEKNKLLNALKKYSTPPDGDPRIKVEMIKEEIDCSKPKVS